MESKFIVADQAVSVVDLPIRVSLLNMLYRPKDEFDVTFLNITHDEVLARLFALEERITVMYLGGLEKKGLRPA